MTSKPLITTDITVVLSDIIRKCVELQTALPKLVERAAIPSGGPQRRGGSEGRNSVGGHSDPTGEQVVTGWVEESPGQWRYIEPVHDPFTAEVLAALKCLPFGRRWIEEAYDHARRAQQVPASELIDQKPEALVCINCARYGVIFLAEEGHSGARCAACRKYRNDHQTPEGLPMDRPEELVTAANRNRKVRESYGVTILEPKEVEHIDPRQHHGAA